MARSHLSYEEFMALLGTERPPRKLLEELIEHHLESCDACRAEFTAGVEGRARSSTVGGVIERALALAGRRVERLGEIEQEAAAELQELMRLQGEKRRPKITRALTRFRNPALVDLLIEECVRATTIDAFEAYELAECALEVALRIPHSEFGRAWAMTCMARAHAYRANALRATGDFKRAESLLAFALEVFDGEGNADPLVEGELLEMFGLLRIEQRRLVDAEGYFDMAKGVYEKIGAALLVGRVLVRKGMVLYHAGEPARAIPVAESAVSFLDPTADPKLHLSAQHNLSMYLAESGRLREAAERLERNAPLYDQFADAWTQLRRQWLRGKIAYGLGEGSAAEALFTEVRQSFLRIGLGYDAALAGLDLALLYVQQGRTAEVKRLAEEMVPVFMAQDVHREATAALLLFQEAARKEAVSAAMLAELVSYLRRVESHPQDSPAG